LKIYKKKKNYKKIIREELEEGGFSFGGNRIELYDNS